MGISDVACGACAYTAEQTVSEQENRSARPKYVALRAGSEIIQRLLMEQKNKSISRRIESRALAAGSPVQCWRIACRRCRRCKDRCPAGSYTSSEHWH